MEKSCKTMMIDGKQFMKKGHVLFTKMCSISVYKILYNFFTKNSIKDYTQNEYIMKHQKLKKSKKIAIHFCQSCCQSSLSGFISISSLCLLILKPLRIFSFHICFVFLSLTYTVSGLRDCL